jgi:hypothetical protein
LRKEELKEELLRIFFHDSYQPRCHASDVKMAWIFSYIGGDILSAGVCQGKINGIFGRLSGCLLTKGVFLLKILMSEAQ